jgi:hypothetical protein
MIAIIVKSLVYLFLYILGLSSGYLIFSLAAFLIFVKDLYNIYTLYNEQFLANLFVNFTLFFFVFSCLLLDFFPNIYLLEVDAFSSFKSITPLAMIYLCPILGIINRPIKIVNAEKYFHKISRLTLELVTPFIWISFLVLVALFLNLFKNNGLPIAEGIHRVIFYNQLSSYESALYVILSLFSALFGFLQFHSPSKKNVFGLVLIILIRILSMQKFTELFIDVSLFFAFQSFQNQRIKEIFSRVSPLQIASLVLTTFLLIGFSVFTYDYETEILLGRFLAQSQLFLVIVADGLNLLPNTDLISREFQNFSGSNEHRLYLFGMGQYYGLYTLMDVANTGRDLYLQASENTSAAGSFPAINILLFGWLLGYPITILSTYIVCFVTRGILILSVATRNPLIVIFGTLILIRCYKYFVIGSPSYLYNVQFFKYGILLLLVTAFHFFYTRSKEVTN